MDIVLSPSPIIDNLSSFPFSSLPTFRQVDESLGDIIFTTQFGETDRLADRLATQATKDVSTSPNPASGKKTASCSTKPPGRRRRSLRKDRHSKIRTSQGLRDRRMRLSLDVAPEFFDIQDMLGFDKASKTLRWLITAAKPAVEELVAASRPGTSATNSRGSSKSSIKSGNMMSTSDKGKSAASATQRETDAAPKAAKRVVRRHPPSRRAAFPATIARESRLQARARARERTEKKSLLQSSSFDRFPVDVKEDSSLDQLVAEVEEHCSQSPRELLGSGTGRWDELGVTIFDYNQSLMCPIDATVNLFHEQWDMERMLQQWEEA